MSFYPQKNDLIALKIEFISVYFRKQKLFMHLMQIGETIYKNKNYINLTERLDEIVMKVMQFNASDIDIDKIFLLPPSKI